MDRAAAHRVIAASALFDAEWLSTQTGIVYDSRDEAVDDWLTRWAPAGGPKEGSTGGWSPHPLFEPRWLYPGERWRGKAPDPLSFWLSRPGARRRSPHPCWRDELGDLEAWARDHDPAELLIDPVGRAAPGEVVVAVPGDDPVSAVRWVRHLLRSAPEVTVEVCPTATATRRILGAETAEQPKVWLSPVAASGGRIRIDVAVGVLPPRWPWLTPLVQAVGEHGAACALLLDEEFVVAGPVLAGHPVADAERLAGSALPIATAPVIGRAAGSLVAPVLVTDSRLVVDRPSPRAPLSAAQLALAGFTPERTPLTVREGRPALRWSLDIAAGAGPIGRRWGDYHFARSLADALSRLGQWVAIDHPETRSRASREWDDVVLVLRGLDRVEPPGPGTTSLLWVISHPDQVTGPEAAAFDRVYAASAPWAAARSADWSPEVTPLVQCTDAGLFGPGRAPDAGAPEVVFVGNARPAGAGRPVVSAAIEAGVPVSVYGAGWEGLLPRGQVRWEAEHVDNASLAGLYAGAGVVVADHHDDMRAAGFVANRVFDVLAAGGRLVCDDVAGLDQVLPGAPVSTWHSASDLPSAIAAARSLPPTPEVVRRIVTEHSFDARARRLLDDVLRLRGQGS